MARVRFSPPVEAYQGTPGTQVFQERNGQAIVGRRPDRSYANTEALLMLKSVSRFHDQWPVYKQLSKPHE